MSQVLRFVMPEEQADKLYHLSEQVASLKDKVKKILDDLDRGPGAREVSLAITKLDEAEMWLTRPTDFMREGDV